MTGHTHERTRSSIALLVATALLMIVVAPAVPARSAFPGKNGRIAFVRSDLNTGSCPNGDIWTMSADGDGEHMLARPYLGVIGGVAWSADGKRIAFTVQTELHEPRGVIGVHVINADGTGETGLQNIPVSPSWRCDPQGPTWSPDGTRIAVAGVGGIWVVNVGGGAPTLLTPNAPDYYDQPAWSPDGKQIAVRVAARGAIGLIPPRGGAATLLDLEPMAASQPNWSPDGSRLAFEIDIGGSIGIYDRCDSSFSTIRARLYGEHDPAWTPDGESILSSVDVGDGASTGFDVWKVSPAGGDLANLTVTPYPIRESAPDQQPLGDREPPKPCGQELIVNSAGDRAEVNPGDGRCDTGRKVSGRPECTLRAAIQEANGTSRRERIRFALPGSLTIEVGARLLPALTGGVTIEGDSQPGVILRSTADTGRGLELDGDANQVLGLTVVGFPTGIVIRQGDRNRVAGNTVGSPDGRNTDGATTVGVAVMGGLRTVVGGRKPGSACDGACNVIRGGRHAVLISGPSQLTTVSGNHLGVTRTGLAAFPWFDDEAATVLVEPGAIDVRIGGSEAARGNVIGGAIGVVVLQNGARIVGNRIGVGVDGSTSLGVEVGVEVSADDVFVGGGGADPGSPPGNRIMAGRSAILVNGDRNRVAGNLLEPDPAHASIALGVYVSINTSRSVSEDTTIAGNRIVGFSGDAGASMSNAVGISVVTSVRTTITRNVIGLDADGVTPRPNGIGISVFLSPGTLVEGNVVSGNLQGMSIRDDADSTPVAEIRGNRVGTDASGRLAIPNRRGITINGPGIVGGTRTSGLLTSWCVGPCNLISGNVQEGVELTGGAQLVGNFIGTDVTGAAAIPNGVGVQAPAGTASIGGASVSEANLIAFNLGPGVLVQGDARVAIRNDRIHSNGGLGIDLSPGAPDAPPDGPTPTDILDDDDGPNGLQNAPVIRAVVARGAAQTIVSGDVTTGGVAGFAIDVYGVRECDPSGTGEGDLPLGSTTTSSIEGGAFSVIFPTPSEYRYVTTTVTGPEGTSEFSACVANPVAPPDPRPTARPLGSVEGRVARGDR